MMKNEIGNEQKGFKNMAGVDQLTLLYNLANDLFWGIVKAEKRMTGRTTIYTKMVAEELSTMFIGALEEFGVKFESKADPLSTILHNLEILKAIGVYAPEDIESACNDKNLHLTVKKCPFSMSCSKLIGEEIKEFGCVQMAIFNSLGKKSGTDLKGKSVNEPGNCQIDFTY
jgi:hypothetical protein